MESNIRAFLNYLRVEKGLSTNTLHAYRRDLAKFAAFSAKRGLTLDQFQHTNVVDFLRTLYLKKLDSRTVARHLVTIRHLFRFAFTEGIIKEDPAANVQAPKFRRSLPEFLSVADVDRLLAQPDVNSTLGLRDKAMIELLYSTGLRVSELCGLKAADIQTEAGCLRCIGKVLRAYTVQEIVDSILSRGTARVWHCSRPSSANKRQGRTAVPLHS